MIFLKTGLQRVKIKACVAVWRYNATLAGQLASKFGLIIKSIKHNLKVMEVTK